ncbi:VOC family protein [Mycolicibacterium arenosum]|uniref:4a-hydroxytetrahydrobiopterin dehydratase n=1 Tax=Mycolicibacterium arenosum TaxID=2952157 RepID=A0ABT1MCT2_9MYCO|nr:VOC family protein [Mycolicibacterium sp. CAU 1645]MCP9276197.1 4a-hydroxytetrahydrobiopterin dehydratase [Mycolicibacterium sp. CAU 1645]
MTSRGEISAIADPLGWRLILGVLISHVPVASLADAASTAQVAVAAAGDADGHLSVDLLADRVVLRLHTAAVGTVTDHDLRLARAISGAVRTAPGHGDAVPQNVEIAIDALDIPLIRPFWQAVTGYVGDPGPPDLPDGALLDPLRRGPTIWFQQMDAPRHRDRNRIHLDVDVPPEHAQARIDAALAAGGVMRDAGAAPAFWVLADPEGNEACVCTWQGRD